MQRSDLTGKLKLLGLKRGDFAAMLGVSIHTTYHWTATPRYVDVVVDLLEEVKRLKGNLFKKKEP